MAQLCARESQVHSAGVFLVYIEARRWEYILLSLSNTEVKWAFSCSLRKIILHEVFDALLPMSLQTDSYYQDFPVQMRKGLGCKPTPVTSARHHSKVCSPDRLQVTRRALLASTVWF
jgi:hypothetical protein